MAKLVTKTRFFYFHFPHIFGLAKLWFLITLHLFSLTCPINLQAMKNCLITATLILAIATSCSKSSINEGVSLNLSQQRKEQITNISYNLHFNIPVQKSDSITGTADITFDLQKKTPIILDFRASNHMVTEVSIHEQSINSTFENGHIIIPAKHLSLGTNSVRVKFTSNDGSLNRSEEFLYTLLVPDRASTVFPCFDQPDLKATFKLSLTIPAQWTAISNGMLDSENSISSKEKQLIFKQTEPISTYLFAFAAGKFERVSNTINGREFTAYHRETDACKLKRNLPIIFNLHAQSLQWLEDYTGIPYPFGKLDFILIPGFQYSGMEHPGAIFYRDSRLLLDENPTENQQLRQANLIAHEVAHQWFGNLVTMRWFNDVWLKEVFAGYMADLIVNPQYSNINHGLSFLLSHFPSAYSVDRTAGANPIVQDLENMLNAGSLYGDIIYHKAPIMMQQLVLLMGKEQFRLGVKEYLKTYTLGNANWDELISILDSYTDQNLAGWSKTWTQVQGRPAVGYSFDNESKTIAFTNFNSSPFPPMWIDICSPNGKSIAVWLEQLPTTISVVDIYDEALPIIANSSGLGYGYFAPDSLTLSFLFSQKTQLCNPITRASNHLSWFEMFLDQRINTDIYVDYLLNCLEVETESQIQSYLLGTLSTVFWRFVNHDKRDQLAVRLEKVLWTLFERKLPVDQKRAVFATLSSVFTTDQSFSKLYSAWGLGQIGGITLSESERTRLAYELMIRKPELYHTIAFGEVERINNPDRIAQFDFTLGAVSPNPSHRIEFFEKLKNPANRKPEPWVTEALRWLHHPLRSDFSIRFIEPSLNLLPEIQRTGDIFFPKSCLDATLWGHSSPEAKKVVNDWIEANPYLSPNLKMKLIQSADMLYRANGDLGSVRQ